MAEVVIVGAGPAGIRAAGVLAAQGLRPILVDEGRQAGGQGYRHPSPGLALDMDALMGTEAGKYRALHADFAELLPLIDYRPRTLVWGIEERRLHCMRDGRQMTIPFDVLVIATGAMDRVAPLPGWTLPGVFTLGGAQAVLKDQGCLIGRRVAFLGASPLLSLAALQYRKLSAQVVAVCDTSPFRDKIAALPRLAAVPRTLARGIAYLAALKSARVPLFHGVTPLAIEGDREVTALRFLDGRPGRPDSVGAVETGVAATGGAATLLQYRWRQATSATGGMRERRCEAVPCAGSVGWSSVWLPHWLQLWEKPPLPRARTWRLSWEGSGTAWARLPRPADLSGGGRLAARIATDPSVGDGVRVELAVRDNRGRSAFVPVPEGQLVFLSSTDVERKLWGQQVDLAVAKFAEAAPDLNLGRITHVGLRSQSEQGRVFVLDLWHRRGGLPKAKGPRVPQVIPKLRFRRVKGRYQVRTGVRVIGPTPRQAIRARLEVTGFCAMDGGDVTLLERMVRVPAGRRSLTLRRVARLGKHKLTNMIATLLPLRGAVSRSLRVRYPVEVPTKARCR